MTVVRVVGVVTVVRIISTGSRRDSGGRSLSASF